MVLLPLSVSAMSESSVDALYWRDAVGVMVNAGSEMMARHHGMARKCPRSGSFIILAENKCF